jgi:hypothetical protein
MGGIERGRRRPGAMSRFLTPLETELMTDANGMPLRTRAGRQLFRLLARFAYQSDVAGLIVAEAGFVTDLCSQPQFTMSLLGECAQQPSVPHDLAYSQRKMPRALADRMLFEACILTGVPRWKAMLIYAGVRIGGGSHWTPAIPVAPREHSMAP